MAEEQTPSQPAKAAEEESSASSTNQSRKQKGSTGVQFPVEQIRKKLKQGQYSDKVGGGSAVYMAAVLEYLTAEFLEVAGNQTGGPNKRIIPHHLKLAAQKDQELAQLLCAPPPAATPAPAQHSKSSSTDREQDTGSEKGDEEPDSEEKKIDADAAKDTTAAKELSSVHTL